MEVEVAAEAAVVPPAFGLSGDNSPFVMYNTPAEKGHYAVVGHAVLPSCSPAVVTDSVAAADLRRSQRLEEQKLQGLEPW